MKYRAFPVVRVVLLIFVLAALSDASAAQSGQESLYGLTQSGAVNNPLSLLRQRLSSSVASGTVSPLEGAVDPDMYTVGPGDLFTVSIAGQDLAGTPIQVGADGKLVLPGSVTVDVADLTLTQARASMLKALRGAFEHAGIDISLAQARSFYVHVTGATPTPGRYLALPVSRVSSILEIAFSDTTRAPVKNPNMRPSFRNIRVVRRDGTERHVDLLRYFSGGHLDSNPHLRDGDMVFVPSFDPDIASVYIAGAVPFPGAYDFRPGDTIGDLIEVAGGVQTQETAARIRLQRYEAGERSVERYAIEDVLSGDAGNTRLRPLDQLSIAPATTVRGTIELAGELEHPGQYPIVEGKTTLAELIEAAGGVTERALPRGAYLERRSLPQTQPPAEDRFSPGNVDYGDILAADTTAIMMRLRMTELDFLSRAYFAQETRLQRRVSVDVEKVLAGSSEQIMVRDGDTFFVPLDDGTIYVFGQVNQPGYISWSNEKTADYYIRAAGGRGDNAGDAYLMHPGTGAVSEPGSRPIASGDILFVDRDFDIADNAELQRLVLEESRVKQDARIRTVQAIAQTVSSISAVIALIITLRKQ